MTRFFEIPPHWQPIPWDRLDMEISRRCGSTPPVKPWGGCGRRDEHPGVCIGTVKGSSGMRYLAWWVQ